MVEDTKRQQLDGESHLQEANEFAKWSHNDREKRLPKLTPEQETQLMQYLQLVEQVRYVNCFISMHQIVLLNEQYPDNHRLSLRVRSAYDALFSSVLTPTNSSFRNAARLGQIYGPANGKS